MSKLIEPSRMKDRVIGFDIGQNGGLCINHLNWGILSLTRMPKTPIDLFVLLKKLDPHAIMTENVHTMPQQGVVSNGKLLWQRGVLEGVCAALGIAVVFIEPLEWIKCYTVKRRKHFKDKPAWKKHLLDIAQEICPTIRSGDSDKLDTWTADAFLIWNYYASILVNEKLPPRGELNFL